MANYSVTRSCGHVEQHNLFGKSDQRQWRIEQMENSPCSDCWLQAQAKGADKVMPGLPELTGSEKQVQWAKSIRAQMIRTVEQHIRTRRGWDAPLTRQGAKIILSALKRITSARTWIDNKFCEGVDSIYRFVIETDATAKRDLEPLWNALRTQAQERDRARLTTLPKSKYEAEMTRLHSEAIAYEGQRRIRPSMD